MRTTSGIIIIIKHIYATSILTKVAPTSTIIRIIRLYTIIKVSEKAPMLIYVTPLVLYERYKSFFLLFRRTLLGAVISPP